MSPRGLSREALDAGARERGSRGGESVSRERIVDVAADLFYRRGIRAVGVDTLIAEAGVAKMTFYRHFPSKDDLIVAFLRRRDSRWRNWLTTQVARRTASPGGRLLAVFDALAEWCESEGFRGCAFVNASAELADRTHPAHQAILEHKAHVEAYLADLAAAAGQPEPRRLARWLALLADGAIVTALREGTAAAVHEARGAAERLLGGSGSPGLPGIVEEPGRPPIS